MPTKIIVIDDDPTDSQTVHSCWLLSRWDVATLKRALADTSPLLFILSNTRAFPAREAACIIREICTNLKVALEGFSDPTLFVSRSDSTLRGHDPLETDILAEALGPFDAHFLIPAFFEGGRLTVDSVHYLKIGDEPVPVDQTEFARDSVFGYRHAYLPAYVEEKTRGRIPAGSVQRFTLGEVRRVLDYASRLRRSAPAGVGGGFLSPRQAPSLGTRAKCGFGRVGRLPAQVRVLRRVSSIARLASASGRDGSRTTATVIGTATPSRRRSWNRPSIRG
jgi:uncharacterized protein YgbK (DUF1537 family)